MLSLLGVMTPTGVASAAVCADYDPSGPSTATPDSAIGPFLNSFLGIACGPAFTGTAFASAAPPCPPVVVIALPGGVYCSISVPVGARVTCTIDGAGANMGAVVVGLDVVPDGSILAGEPASWSDKDSGYPWASVTNTGLLEARAIAYVIPGSAGAITVGCALT